MEQQRPREVIIANASIIPTMASRVGEFSMIIEILFLMTETQAYKKQNILAVHQLSTSKR